MFENQSLKYKMVGAFLGVTLFMILIAIVGLTSQQQLFENSNFITKKSLPSLNQSSDIGIHIRDTHQHLLNTEVTDDPANEKKFHQMWIDEVANHDRFHTEYLKKGFISSEEEKTWEQYLVSWKQYVIRGQEYFTSKFHKDPAISDQAAIIIETTIVEGYEGAKKGANKLYELNEAQAIEMGKSTEDSYNHSNILTWSISLVGIIAATLTGFLFANMVSNRINKITERIASSSTETSSASHELTTTSVQLSSASSESAASLQETVSSLEELSAMVKQNSDHAKEANSISKTSLDSAERGEQEIGKLINSMDEMSTSSKKIEEIINVIDDIAFQTNLLALNAAVEAARAGEQGKGFAVVADAVRNLAQRSAVAAKDINSLIKDNVEKAIQSSRIADESGEVLKEIVTSAKKVSSLNSEISSASQEQAHGIEQIAKAMNHLDASIQTNASSSEEVAASAQEMTKQAEDLTTLVHELTKFTQGKSVEISSHLSKVKQLPKRQQQKSKEIGA